MFGKFLANSTRNLVLIEHHWKIWEHSKWRKTGLGESKFAYSDTKKVIFSREYAFFHLENPPDTCFNTQKYITTKKDIQNTLDWLKFKKKMIFTFFFLKNATSDRKTERYWSKIVRFQFFFSVLESEQYYLKTEGDPRNIWRYPIFNRNVGWRPSWITPLLGRKLKTAAAQKFTLGLRINHAKFQNSTQKWSANAWTPSTIVPWDAKEKRNTK